MSDAKKSRLDSSPIAIIGVGCRFPQAGDASAFWRNVVEGRACFGPVPRDRWNHEVFFNKSQREVDKAWTGQGGFIEDIRSFAALHYGLAPRRLDVMDPQQRLLIETTRTALLDAGYDQRSFPRDRTGVFAGVSVSEFKNVVNSRLLAMQLAGGDFGPPAGSQALRDALMEMVESVAPIRAFTLAGSLTALAASSISQVFNLGGPAYTIDAACASASVAVHDAVLQLRAGLIDLALAGGAYLNLSPDNLVAFTRIGAISPSGVCRPFDHRADGFVQSDGVGMLLLKRLDDALHDGDRIHALVIGTGCNNDGRGEGPMTPRAEGQLAALRAAYADAGVSPASVSYFEAHGTATSVGDPVEVLALGTLLGEAGVRPEDPALIGSVKGNIGHAMSAAGLAGLIKAIAVLEHGTAPPHPGFERPHPALGLERFPLEVPSGARPLPARGAPLRAAVSSFGFGGTNSHLVLEQAPPRRRAVRPATAREQPEVVLLSAAHPDQLARYLGGLAAALRDSSATLADVAYTLNARRRLERARVVITARSKDELLGRLAEAQAALERSPGTLPAAAGPDVAFFDRGPEPGPTPKLAFLFPGQGAQKVGLLEGLYRRFPRFREAFERLATAGSAHLSRPLARHLYPDRSTWPLDQGERAQLHLRVEAELTATEVCQPAMTALSLALVELLADLGLHPDVSLGHSLGEFGALASQGVLTSEAAVHLVAERGRAMRDLPLSDPGTMAAVRGTVEEVRSALGDLAEVWVANVNHPRQVSISGTKPGVARALEALRARGLEARPLSVSHAFHTPLLAGIDAPMRAALAEVALAPPRGVVASSVAPAIYDGDLARTRQVLLGHATAPVDFARGLEQARAAGAQVFVQLGAGGLLAGFARATLPDARALSLAAAEEDEGLELLRAVATLAALGHRVDFEPLYAGEGRQVVTLPDTPLVRESYWPVKGKQPRAVLDHPLPAQGAVTQVRGAAPAEDGAMREVRPDASLVELFRQQAELLKTHAEIIANQTRVLLGEAPAGPVPEASTTPNPRTSPEARQSPPPGPAATHPGPTATPPEQLAKAVAPAVERAAAQLREPPGQVKEKVFEIVARISAFPRQNIRGEQKLVDELGFDSLMVADLGGAIRAAYPAIQSLPPSLFSLTTTVADIAGHVERTLGGAAPAPAPAPVAAPRAPAERYRPVLLEEALSPLPPHEVKGETWLLTEGAGELAQRAAAELERRGARVLRVRFTRDGVAAPAKLQVGRINLWPEAFAEGLAGALAEAQLDVSGFIHAAGLSDTGHVASDDRRAATAPVLLLHALLQRLDPPRVLVVTGLGGRLGLEATRELPRNLAQAALLGYTKALARERPAHVVRALDVDPAERDAGRWAVEEILSPELCPEVGWSRRGRVVPVLARLEGARAERRLGADDVVLITGGAGALGRVIAKRVAGEGPRAVLLVGRSAAGPEQQALVAELERRGPRAAYLAADATDPQRLAAAVQAAGFGAPTVVIHAAGFSEDAMAPRKTAESAERVLAVKITGAQAVLTAFPELKDLVLFSSWAGRFGNAGQTDYAAANAWLEALAVSGAGRARVVAIDWPPWGESPMVAKIPGVVRQSLEASGVSFLDDQEGARLYGEIFASSPGGVELVGRALPARTDEVRAEETFTLEQHPYLADHRLKGRPVLPLAAAADLIAWTASGGRAERPLIIEGLTLFRGVFGGERVTSQARRRTTGRETRSEVELKSGAEVAYRAVVHTGGSPAILAAAPLAGAELTPRVTLAEFYQRHTFHGPLLRGVERVERMTEAGVEGVVSTSEVEAWWPGRGRGAWAVDPLVLDASFQLAGLWAFTQLARGGYPTGFDRLTLLEPFGAGKVRARLLLGRADEETFQGTIRYESLDGRPLALLEGIRGRLLSLEESAPAPAPGNGHPPAAKNGAALEGVPPESFDIAAFPEVEALDQRIQMAELIGLRNPYFHVHAGTARDTSVVDGVEMINFSSYNYLGFSGHPEVLRAAQAAIERYGTSVSASRIASGERPVHRELELGIARHIGVDDSIVYVSGHATNVTTIGHLLGEQDLVVHDSLIHDSILQGIHLSGATRRPYPHGDLDALERLLGQLRRNYRRVLIPAEGIYSMDGDICDLPRLIALKQRYKALLLLDEAHSIGVLGPAGRGVGHHFPGVNPRDVDLWMGTLSKSFASCGGYIAGSAALVRYLKYTAPGFVYSAGITPPNAAAALKSLELMNREPAVVERLRHNSRFFLELAKRRGLDTGLAMGAAVVPVIVGNSLLCMRLSAALAARRINVQPIVYPAVEDDAARLRFFLSATHSEEQLTHTVDVVVEELARVRQEAQREAAPSA